MAALNRCVQGYLDPNRPTKETIYQNVRCAIDELKEDRIKSGLSKLNPPCREAVRLAIGELDDFEVCLAREGLETARRKFASVSVGVGATRPLQRIEKDEWTADLITLLEESDFFSAITPEERAALGLDRKSLRVLITVAICTATKCIVGLCISPVGSTDSALQTIEMIMQDKGVYSDAVGALSPWHMYGTPELIITDCANYNISAASHFAMDSVGCRIEHCPAGKPQMKGVIERLFRTVSINLLPRLSGRTFHDVVTRGDRDPTKEAALSVNEFCDVLTRWIVDIYHRKPHQGLGGEAPIDVWNRLVNQFGVRPAPDRKTRALAFGQETERRLKPTGITVMGIRYHNNVLASLLLRDEKAVVKLRWHPADLGSIFVQIGIEWHEVPNVGGAFNGVSALHWDLTRRALRTQYKERETVHFDVVRKALAEIERVNKDAMERAGLQVQKWTKQKVEQIEAELSIGLSVNQDPADEQPSTDGFGLDLPTAPALEQPADVSLLDDKSVSRHKNDVSVTPEPTPRPSHRRSASSDDWTFGEK
ncbi:hypothetical protein CEP88_09440 [Roseobacter denitrificans]|uniref:Mu transposase C-terminal domain-containing protein n=1 Tax=Roseobacter denitrificans TaxID=2434 RepID=UPI0006804C42|nr:Mu transposase C-terminal domain-containing protein [Roseobacter denitrificans]AVL52802.1 hypothetical protein CEP88_09440 [Roseobacter denitrificans]SFG05301.1 putative transposase [Roseobacter denitrificans OCh 114]